MSKQLIFYCDGLCEPRNPGGYACWAWLAIYDGRQFRQQYGCIGHGAGMTNNEAEYEAVLQAMRYAESIKGRIHDAGLSVLVRTDSQLVVNQVSGLWQIKIPRRQIIPIRAILFNEFQGVIEWVPREQNSDADMLTRLAYAEARRSAA